VNEKPRDDSRSGSRDGGFLFAAARYTSIAMALPGATFAGYIVGYELDKWMGTSYLKIVFLLLGIAGGFYELIRQLVRDMEKSK
jgi:F0F1-type ATP synthase assembly protein I